LAGQQVSQATQHRKCRLASAQENTLPCHWLSFQFFSFSVFGFFFAFFFCRFSHFSARKTSWRPDFFLPSNAKPSLTCSSAFDSCLVCSLLIISLIKFMVHKPEISIQMHRGQGVRRKAKDFK